MARPTDDIRTRPSLVPELSVSDLAASLRFWVAICGFRVDYERPEEGFAYLERDGAALMLEQRDRASRTWETGTLEAPFGRGVNFEITVEDLDHILSRIVDAAWPLFLSPEEKAYRRDDVAIVVRQFLVQDPDGYLVRFSQRLAEKPLAG